MSNNNKIYFTKTEKEILQHIKNGVLRSDIPSSLYISNNTFKKHLERLYSKIDINTYEELIRYVLLKRRIK